MAAYLLRYPSLLVVAVASLIMLVDLGGAKLWDRDEPRNAGCAQEMLARGDWVVPTFNDELRHQKPVLLYWVMMVSYQAFGVSEWSARCGSALAAIGTCWLTYVLGRRLFSVQVGIGSAVMLATSLMFIVAGRAATPDSLLIFFQTAVLAVYVLGSPGFQSDRAVAVDLERDFFPRRLERVALFYGLMGGGVLAKGAIAMVMPSLIVGLHLLYMRSQIAAPPRAGLLYKCTLYRLGAMFHPRNVLPAVITIRPVFGLAIVLAIAAPWFLAVSIRTHGEYLRLFWVQEHLGRATQAFENHRGGWWYYPLAISFGFFPWSVFLIPTLWGLGRRWRTVERAVPAASLLTIWILAQVGLFSCVATKLPSYVTPCYPALALAVAAGLAAVGTSEAWAPPAWYRWSLAGLGLSAVAVFVGAIVLLYQLTPGLYALLIVAGVWLEGAVLAWLMFRGGRPAWGTKTLAISAIVAAVVLFGVVARQVSGYRKFEGELAQITRQLGHPPLASFRCLESSWVYYAQDRIWELAETATTAAPSAQRQAPWQPKPRLAPAEFVAVHPNAVLITTDAHWGELQQQLPRRYRIVRTVRFFPRNKSLLIAVPEEVAATVGEPRIAYWKNAGVDSY